MSTEVSEQTGAPTRCARHETLFEGLARRFHAGVYNYLCWISRDPGLAEDLTQETFMQVWQHISEVRNNEAARAWLYRIARNQFLQHRRRARLDVVSFDGRAEADQMDRSQADPQIILERGELREAVHRAVHKLPDLYREVIVLHNWEHLSLGQVARILEVPVGTVKSRRAKAYSVLRHLLQQEVTDDEL